MRTSVGRKANQTGHAENLTSHQQNEAHKGPIEEKFVGKKHCIAKEIKEIVKVCQMQNCKSNKTGLEFDLTTPIRCTRLVRSEKLCQRNQTSAN